MKKTLLFLLPFAISSASGAGCEYFSGYAASDALTFYSKADACAGGQTETTSLKIVDNSAGCGTGWAEIATIKEVVCDSAKGVCGAAYTCPAP